MADSIVGRLRVLLGLDTAEFEVGAEKAKSKAKGLGGELSALGKTLGVSLGIGALTLAVKKVADYAGELEDLSAQTGLTTTTLQQMSFAAKQTGTSLDAFTNSAFKLGVNLASGTNLARKAVDDLGLSYAALLQQSPDEQFRTIARALGGVEDAQERNKLAVQLFGKTAKEILPAIAQGYDQLADSANVAGESQIAALDEAGDALSGLKDDVLNLGVLIAGSLVIAIREAVNATNEWIGVTRTLQRGMEGWAIIFETLGLKTTAVPKVLNEMKVAAGNLPAPLSASARSADDLEAATKKLDAELEISVERNKAAAEAAKQFAESLRELSGANAAAGAKEVLKQLEALGGPLNVLPGQLEQMADRLREGAQAAMLVGDADLAGQYSKLADTLDPLIQFQQRYNVTLGEYVTLTPQAATWTEELVEQLHRLGGTVIEIGPVLQSSMVLPWTRFKAAVDQVPPSAIKAESAITSLRDSVKNMGNTILQAVQGGGSVLGSIGSSLGLALGQDLSKNLSGFLTKNLGKTLGEAVGAVLPGLGALLGPGLSALGRGLKSLFGIGINEPIKKANAEIEVMRQNLLKSFGSFENIARLGQVVGIDLAGAWRHQGEAGKKAFKEMSEEFVRRVDAMQDELGGLQDDLASAFDEARDLGYVFDRTGQLISVSFEKMRETASEFGVDLASLGPAFQAQRLAADARRIVDAFTLLSKGGTDAGTILFGLKDEISALVNESRRFGTTIPENMRPWIQNLIDTGQLLDENGKAITDIGQIKFGAAIETQFEAISRKISDLIGRIDDMIRALGDLLPLLDAATRDRTGHIGWNVDPLPEQLFTGGGGESGGYEEPRFATGTMGVLGKWFGNFGSGMRATLDNVEAVVTPEQAPAFALDVLSGLSRQQGQQAQSSERSVVVRNVTENRILIDGTEMKRWIVEQVTTAIENNERGLRSRMRDGLGVTA